MRELAIYGTLGPSCCHTDMLVKMLQVGMTGVRLNLSHGDLCDCQPWLQALQAAQRQTAKQVDLLIDMKGAELRIDALTEPLLLKTGTLVRLGDMIPVPSFLFSHLHVKEQLLLDDGKLLLEVVHVAVDHADCRVLRGGELLSHKSIALANTSISLPALTASDHENIRQAKACGVTGIMVPFVRSADDLREVKAALRQHDAEHLRIYAKIENEAGVRHIEELLPYCDVIVIARGDLGNAVPLWELPQVQMEIADLCKKHHKPYMVVTQMLHSMIEQPVPTRAEVSDIYHAVYHGAAAIMLTGETAAGKYPLEAMTYFVKTAQCAQVALAAKHKERKA